MTGTVETSSALKDLFLADLDRLEEAYTAGLGKWMSMPFGVALACLLSIHGAKPHKADPDVVAPKNGNTR